MAKLTFDISMSLDGFIAGPNVGPGKGLGDGGDRLHVLLGARARDRRCVPAGATQALSS
jgi:hypothetical protein